MRRALKFALVAWLLAAFSPQSAVRAQGWEEGVPHALALQRAAQLEAVAYDLRLTVPDTLSLPVGGSVTIAFSLHQRADVVLDFQGRLVGPSVVNGRHRRLVHEREHIVVPRRYLHRGRNELTLHFLCSDLALNRQRDYLYTLFVPDHARSCFPCFDQPDLKALFRLHLTLPEGWTSLASDSLHPLPTYLFSFTAGRFSRYATEREGRPITILHRETDTAKVAQLPQVADLMARSISWMEDYTGIPQPFSTYGAVVLPGFQFGGMEHPGAIQLTDRRIFLPPQPTLDERLSRLNLIAHETAHLWFGDLVTMRWFDDVWTKEVFANFMAAKVAQGTLTAEGAASQALDFLKSYQLPALATDRTPGTHPIQQPLANLNQASLLYGNIIYDKAPVMMRKLEQLVGADAFRQGLQLYLRRYAYGNATWDGLVEILDSLHPGTERFSHVWVKERGLPLVTTTVSDGCLQVRQHDPLGRGLAWPQQFQVGLLLADSTLQVVDVVMDDTLWTQPLDAVPLAVVPNYDGSGYGRFVADVAATPPTAPLQRYAWMMTLYENYLMGRVAPSSGLRMLLPVLESEAHPLVASTCLGYVARMMSDLGADPLLSSLEADTLQARCQRRLLSMADAHQLPSLRQQVLRLLATTATDPQVLAALHAIWQQARHPLLSEQDYVSLSYRLAMMRPDEWQSIVAVQRSRIANADRLRAFDYVSRGCNPSPSARDSLFAQLLQRENRVVEPWAQQLLSLLSTRDREPYNNRYIADGLAVLPEIQQTGGIFFPAGWTASLLGGHRSGEAQRLVQQFLDDHPALSVPLRNKILERAYYIRPFSEVKP